MKNQNAFDNFSDWLTTLTTTQKRNLTIAITGGLSILALMSLWNITVRKDNLQRKILAAKKNLDKAIELSIQNTQIEHKESSFAQLTSEQPSQGIIPLVDSLIAEANANPSPGWKETKSIVIPPNDASFEEERVSITLEGINTEQLTTFLEAVRRKPLAMVREAEIDRSQAPLLSATLLIGTRNLKVGI